MIRKIFTILPRKVQEKIKLIYYNLSIPQFSFSKEQNCYRTQENDRWSILTKSPLYFIVKDISRYEKYYKVAPGDIVIDGGANEGVLSLVYSQKATSTGTIYAFEPDSKNLDLLRLNLALNSSTANIHIQKRGLWKHTDIIEFNEAGTVGSSIFYAENGSIKKKVEVISIDEFIEENNITKLNFIKMDIEGAEIEALKGCRETLKKLRPDMAIASYHIIDGEHTYKRLETFLDKMGYPFKTIFFKDGEIITYAGPRIMENDLTKQ